MDYTALIMMRLPLVSKISNLFNSFVAKIHIESLPKYAALCRDGESKRPD
jgi:hypothetical protein